MGTRGLTCVVLNGEFKVAQYGQWDHYPSGQGKTIYEFLRTPGSLASLRANVAKLTEATNDTIKAKWVECGADPNSDFVGMDVSQKFGRQYPQFSRDTGAGILHLVASGEISEVQLQKEFAADSLFCEYAYVIDLDENVLEVYHGFQKKQPLFGRFKDIPTKASRCGDHYYPVGLVRKFNLKRLPKTVESFVKLAEKACHKDYEENK